MSSSCVGCLSVTDAGGAARAAVLPAFQTPLVGESPGRPPAHTPPVPRGRTLEEGRLAVRKPQRPAEPAEKTDLSPAGTERPLDPRLRYAPRTLLPAEVLARPCVAHYGVVSHYRTNIICCLMGQ